MKLNTSQKPKIFTHEGGKAAHINAEQELRRAVLSCLLWEDEFYEDGKSISDRIEQLCAVVPAYRVCALAHEARTKYNLRHVPLLLLSNRPDATAIYNTISRADELGELLAIYWRNGKRPIPAQMKKGLAKAFTKFDAYALGKYNRDSSVKLRDVLFMTHAKPKDDAQADLWKRLVDGTLESPDTWEVALSAGADKKEVFERLLREEKLGYLALLRNLRNMIQSGCDTKLVKDAILARKSGADRVLPFRFIAAARHAPQFEIELDAAMQHSISALPKLSGTTAVLVDVSGSMRDALSSRSDMTRMDAAAGLGAIISSDNLRLFTFSEQLVEVPPRRGMAGVDAIMSSQRHSGTYLGQAIRELNTKVSYDRLIVITDEQSHDGISGMRDGSKGYLINVASSKNGIGYGQWVHIDGFSENVIRFIHETE